LFLQSFSPERFYLNRMPVAPEPAITRSHAVVIGAVAIILLALLIAPSLRPLQPAGAATEPFTISYHYTAEGTYEDIAVNNTMLVSTYFSDDTHKCDRWVRQQPCWELQDLKTAVYSLSPTEAEALRTTLISSGFMGLNATYGEAQGQRYYAHTLAAADNGAERTVVYQSSPGSPPEPAAFVAVRDALVALKEKKEHHPATNP
jgi:hypothetical protein